jgi:Citrate transporter
VTIALTVSAHAFLDLPPALGMMAGLGLLKGYSFLFNLWHRRQPPLVDELNDVFAEPQLKHDPEPADSPASREPRVLSWSGTGLTVATPAATEPATQPNARPAARPLDIFALLERIEWDTLLFVYGVLLAVGGLGALGYLALTSELLYARMGPTLANVLVGMLSALVDNVPVMFAVLQMAQSMPEAQWLLVTLTTGVGGSLLSVGSAAGVALMGQLGVYTLARTCARVGPSPSGTRPACWCTWSSMAGCAPERA